METDPWLVERTEIRMVGEFDLDGHIDAKGIQYVGKAVRMDDGKWLCLARIGSCLCRVEVSLTFG
jgi:hypothetical protein